MLADGQGADARLVWFQPGFTNNPGADGPPPLDGGLSRLVQAGHDFAFRPDNNLH